MVGRGAGGRQGRGGFIYYVRYTYKKKVTTAKVPAVREVHMLEIYRSCEKKRTEWLVAEFPAAYVDGGNEQADQVFLREDLEGGFGGGLGGQGGDLRRPPGVAVVVGAEDAPVLGGFGVEAGGVVAARQRTGLSVLGVVLLAIRAIRADEALDELLADLLAEVDAFAVEPVFAGVTAYHPSVVVRAPT